MSNASFAFSLLLDTEPLSLYDGSFVRSFSLIDEEGCDGWGERTMGGRWGHEHLEDLEAFLFEDIGCCELLVYFGDGAGGADQVVA